MPCSLVVYLTLFIQLKHFEKFLCVFGGHLISMNVPPPKEKGLMPTPLG